MTSCCLPGVSLSFGKLYFHWMLKYMGNLWRETKAKTMQQKPIWTPCNCRPGGEDGTKMDCVYSGYTSAPTPTALSSQKLILRLSIYMESLTSQCTILTNRKLLLYNYVVRFRVYSSILDYCCLCITINEGVVFELKRITRDKGLKPNNV